MKRNFIYILSIALTFYSFTVWAQAQQTYREHLFTRGHSPMPYTAELVGDKLFFASLEKEFVNEGTIFNSTLYMADSNLRLLDSLTLNSAFNMQQAVLSDLVNIGDSSVALTAFDGIHSLSKGHTNVVAQVDTTMQVLNSARIQGPDTPKVFTTINVTNDSLLWALGYIDKYNSGGHFPAAHIFNLKNFNPIAYRKYDQIPSYRSEFVRMFEIGQGQYLTREGWPPSFRPFFILNQNFKLDSIYPKPPLNPSTPQKSFKLDKVIYYDSTHIYMTGQVNQFVSGRINRYSMGVVKFNQGLEMVRTDTFSIPSPALAARQRGISDYSSMQNIVVASGQSVLYESDLKNPEKSNIIIDSNITRKIYIASYDSSGTRDWFTQIGRDSVYYRLWEVEAIPGGGAYIISAKYDPFYKEEVHTRISIIKLDENGNYVTEREFKMPEIRFSVYPNPAREKLTLEGLPARAEISLNLLNLSGQKIWSHEAGRERKIKLPDIAEGTYMLRLSNEQGQVMGMKKLRVK